MNFCKWKRTCAYKHNCGEWDDVGLCDYYGSFMRQTKPERQHLILHGTCKYITHNPTKAHLKMCESCSAKFYCWTTNYWDNQIYYRK